MNKLFLTSSALITLPLISDLLPKPASELQAIFIPTAGDPYDDKSFVDADRDTLVKMGFSVTDVDLKTTQGNALESALNEADVVFVAGGNTFYLLDYVRKSGFEPIIKKLIRQGVIYIGASAGTILCCPTIEAARQFDPPEIAPDLTDYTGLNLVDFVIIPHAQKEKYFERIALATKEMNDKGLEVVTLTDNQAIRVEGNNRQIVEVF